MAYALRYCIAIGTLFRVYLLIYQSTLLAHCELRRVGKTGSRETSPSVALHTVDAHSLLIIHESSIRVFLLDNYNAVSFVGITVQKHFVRLLAGWSARRGYDSRISVWPNHLWIRNHPRNYQKPKRDKEAGGSLNWLLLIRTVVRWGQMKRCLFSMQIGFLCRNPFYGFLHKN